MIPNLDNAGWWVTILSLAHRNQQPIQYQNAKGEWFDVESWEHFGGLFDNGFKFRVPAGNEEQES